MPVRNPGKRAFVAIIVIAAGVGVLSYIFFGLATPEPATQTPAYDQGLPPPTITTSEDKESGQNSTEQTETVDTTDNHTSKQ
jgi:hypothetical protein